MTPELILLIIIAVLLIIVLARLFTTNNLQGEVQRIEQSVKTEIAANRKEAFEQSAYARKELQQSLLSFEDKLNHLTNTIDHKLTAFSESNNNNALASRTEIKDALNNFKKDLAQSITELNSIQKDNFFALLNKQSEQNTDTSTKLDSMRQTIEQKVTAMQQSNEQKLEQMRITVDEKLQQTLEARLGESFKLVSERLEAVHKGLGDMQQLATGVGDLKRVLSNVKTRGVLGEYQLENILEQTLTTEQYAKNVKTKQGSNALVEFAVKLPGTADKTLWLPIDSKFPKEDFELLLQAYEHGDSTLIEESRKAFVRGIKKCAADICNRYIDPPNTTDFAILFLPFESLYAEVLRTPGLFESIRTEYKINIAGPTTLSAFLSSLQMGFRTLAIEKRSGEVWQLLSAVKTEFGNFAGLLDKAQKNIQTGLDQLEHVAGVRTRAIQKRLRNVDTLPDTEVQKILPELTNEEVSDEE
ncbi:DNA recombination protein RmuC [Panacibacter sp. DH6]|uniref:DNA recombination protein RmuC n=1 Tax=Panacibacter microcysteis TaxID=2793269 RepID=A0A931GZF9_9BACT|nr:DNA recombination protein RmuC [Panacibacter microcysteis]MBG9378194.1 DNA recombination protein RmuC [Panacibacter microcysteis]